MEENENCGCWAVLKRTVSDVSKSSPSSKHSPNSIPRLTLLDDSGSLFFFSPFHNALFFCFSLSLSQFCFFSSVCSMMRKWVSLDCFLLFFCGFLERKKLGILLFCNGDREQNREYYFPFAGFCCHMSDIKAFSFSFSFGLCGFSSKLYRKSLFSFFSFCLCEF